MMDGDVKQRGFKAMVDGKELQPAYRQEDYITAPIRWAIPPYRPIMWFDAKDWSVDVK